METPTELFDKLICENCEGFLSCAPVLLKIDGKSLCGRCTAFEDEIFIRNNPYEELAQLLAFPCKYKEQGCTQLSKFSETLKHEDECEYRQYICPVVASGKCEWIGGRMDLLHHCEHNHPDRILQNPCKLSHDILRSTLDTFLMTAFNVLFLIQIKVCLLTKTIYHCVRFIGDPARASVYDFTLDIERQGCKIVKVREVAPQGCLFLQDNVSLATSINSLLGMLGGYEDTTYTLTVKNTREETWNLATLKKPLLAKKLFNTIGQLKYTGWRMKGGKKEEPVAPSLPGTSEAETKNCTKIVCMYADVGCTYTEEKVRKMKKHERYICQYNSSCLLCSSSIVLETKEEHFSRMHNLDTYQAGVEWSTTISDRVKICIIKTSFGNAFCEYSLKPTEFYMQVFSPLPTNELNTYLCTLQISNPKMGYKISRVGQTLHETVHDWTVSISLEQMMTYIYKSRYILQITFIKTCDMTQNNN